MYMYLYMYTVKGIHTLYPLLFKLTSSNTMVKQYISYIIPDLKNTDSAFMLHSVAVIVSVY